MRPKALLFLFSLLLFQALQSLQAQSPSLAEYRWINFGISFKLPNNFKVAHSSEQDFLAANEQVSLEIHAFSGNIGSAKALAQKAMSSFLFRKSAKLMKKALLPIYLRHTISAASGYIPKPGKTVSFFAWG